MINLNKLSKKICRYISNTTDKPKKLFEAILHSACACKYHFTI